MIEDRTNHNALAAQFSERLASDPRFVEARIGELAEFEARANGTKPHPRSSPRRQALKEASSTIAVADPQTVSGSIVDMPARAPASLLDIIMVAGSDPNFDVEKFRSLVAIQREEQDRADARADRDAELAAEAAFNAALATVQRQMGRIATDAANTSTHSRYASYGALDRVVRPLYTEAGFNISFNEDIGAAVPDMVRVLAYVTHTAPTAKRSHSRIFHTDIPADGKGARGGDVMSKTHAHVSATSYGKRVLLGMIFNIATGNDDDGNAAGARVAAAKVAESSVTPGTISADQAQRIRDLLDQRGIKERAFVISIRLNRIEDIGAEHFDKSIAKINSMERRS